MYISLPLLFVTYQFGLNINEASRWINIPIINQAFQPSDLAKLSLIIYLSFDNCTFPRSILGI